MTTSLTIPQPRVSGENTSGECVSRRLWAKAWTLDRLVCWWLVVAVVFVMGADFRGDTGEDFTVHWQIYLRLLVAFVCGVVGLLGLSKSIRDWGTWPGLLLTAYLGWYAATLPMAIHRTYSAAAWVSLVGVVMFVPVALRLLGGFRAMLALAFGLVAYLVGSWIAYLLFPEVGVFMEQVTQTEIYARMGGLGHPNELGFYSAYTVLVFVALARSGRVSPWWLVCGILLGSVTLLACFSRTAMVVCALGVLVSSRDHLQKRGYVLASVLVLAAGVLVAGLAVGSGKWDWTIQTALKKVTKTGSTDELLTATGRTEIWEYGLRQIVDSPLYGYGYCSARFVMEHYSYHCHNIVLNAMMFGGLVSGFIVLAMMLYLSYSILFSPRPEVDGLAACMLAGGMVEGLLGAASPAASLFIWGTVLLWRQLGLQIYESPSRPRHASLGRGARPEDIPGITRRPTPNA